MKMILQMITFSYSHPIASFPHFNKFFIPWHVLLNISINLTLKSLFYFIYLFDLHLFLANYLYLLFYFTINVNFSLILASQSISNFKIANKIFK